MDNAVRFVYQGMIYSVENKNGTLVVCIGTTEIESITIDQARASRDPLVVLAYRVYAALIA